MVWFIRLLFVCIGGVIGFVEFSRTLKGILWGSAAALFVIGLETVLVNIHLLSLIFGVLGAVVGVVLAKLLDWAVVQFENDRLSTSWMQYSLLVKFALAYLGMILAVKKFPELDQLDRDILATSRRKGQELKLIDTSALIDGRVADICDTHFLSGTVVIPRFVLQELHSMADNADAMRRARGRRGLDIIARLQESSDFPVKILDRDVPNVQEVDAKLVRLAKDLNGKIITTDFNLNKVAALEGVSVLNVNDLSAAMKPVVLPGEEMTVFIMKDGKERAQGVGYLDDGTMVVAEEGRKFIGKRVTVVVSSILQTSAGRMIFSKAKEESRS
ncbi:MAG: hypothetical protein A3G41_07035 [Elusimicrobia bacterium RIFCSPLOWO2_12_FULL_59_9]|nr:MAG: hypothetical protein A3G41_07035 [Elusimicrobia bacterium RIFCSPLOWO2_12_FULL_59_9]